MTISEMAAAVAEATGSDPREVQAGIDALAGCDPFAGLDVPFVDSSNG